MAPLAAPSWRRADDSNDIINGGLLAGQAGFNVPSSPSCRSSLCDSLACASASCTSPPNSNYGPAPSLASNVVPSAVSSDVQSTSLSSKPYPSDALVLSSVGSSSLVPTTLSSVESSSLVPTILSNTMISGSTPTSTVVSTPMGATSDSQTAVTTQKSNHRGAIIGGAVGGVVIIVLLLTLLYCARRRSRQRAVEPYAFAAQSIEGPTKPHACCNYHIGQAVPGHHHKAAPEMQQLPSVDSPGGNFRVGASSPTHSLTSARSSRPNSLNRKRPPPLMLESLVTPVIKGPTNLTRHGPDSNRPRESDEGS